MMFRQMKLYIPWCEYQLVHTTEVNSASKYRPVYCDVITIQNGELRVFLSIIGV